MFVQKVTFQFYKDEKTTQNFARMNSKHFDIYRDEKHNLANYQSFRFNHVIHFLFIYHRII